MDLYLREINEQDKQELLNMVDEIRNDVIEDKFEGFRCIKDLSFENFEDFLTELEKRKNKKKYKPHLVDQTSFILVDENNYIYGGTTIRHELNEGLLNYWRKFELSN